MAMAGGSVGTLQISVVEGRDLPAAAASDAAPHVTLELGPQKVRRHHGSAGTSPGANATQAKTKPAATQSDAGGPKWLTDFKLPVSADVSELKVRRPPPPPPPPQSLWAPRKAAPGRFPDGPLWGLPLLLLPTPLAQVAVVKGDVVVGQASVSLDTVKAKTTVQWYSLRNDAGANAGDICMVIRYINRPAVLPTAGLPRCRRRRRRRSRLGAYGCRAAATANGTATAKESPRAAVAASAEVDKPAAESAPSPRTPPPAPQAKAAPVKAGAPEPELEAKPKPKPAAPKREGAASKEGQSGGGTNVLLATGGVLLAVGLAVTATNSRAARKPKYHEVRPGDTLCGIAGEYCVNPDDIFDANTGVTDDPDRIYPGDRLFIP
eukprot:SM000273S10244  [mRNA]  locus=s273:93673:94985:- [translate_table: standard]